VTPVSEPNPHTDADWSFPDTELGVLNAVKEHGANVLWANTTLHSTHSLARLKDQLKGVRMIGQNPLDTEKYEDKEWINRWLNSQQGLRGDFPKSILYNKSDDTRKLLDFGFPMVLKPIRGRGSHGVTLIRGEEEMRTTARKLLEESDSILVEVGLRLLVSLIGRSIVATRNVL